MRTAVAAILLLAVDGFGQVSSSVSLSNGVQLTIGCSGNPGSLKIELEPATGNSFYRIFRDENNLAIFAYELLVERTPDGDHFRVTAKPAGDDFAARFPNADGGSFTAEIPVIPGVAENLSDVVQVRLNQRGTLAAPPDSQSAAPLRFVGLKVQINGKLTSPGGSGATVAGRYVMFYIPGHGGYFLSTEPVESRPFAKIGIVDRTQMHFTLDNDDYDCYSDAPILPRSDSGEIWVFHDPTYKPSGNWASSDPSTARDEFLAAASDSLKWWLP